MRQLKLTYVLGALGLFLAGSVSAQTADSIKYNHQEVFGPTVWPVRNNPKAPST